MQAKSRASKRDQLRGLLRLPGRPPTRTASVVPQSIPSSQPTTTSTTSEQQFLSSVLSKLSPQENDVIQRHRVAGLDDIVTAVRDAYNAALVQRQLCESKRWTWTFRDTKISLSEEAEKVVLWLDRFKTVGDVVANVDPLHVGLPWAGVRMLLEISVVEDRQMGALLAGMSLALSAANRLEAYCEYHRRLPAMLATENFKSALAENYACLLRFIAIAIQTYHKSTVSRTWHALWETSSLIDFKTECDRLGIRTEIEAASCDREMATQDRSEAEKWKANLNDTLLKLDDIQCLRGSLDALHHKFDLGVLYAASAAGAMYNSYENQHVSRCLPGTRLDLLGRISAWAQDPGGRSIFWLCGMAGTGKSTIARSVAHDLDAKGHLGASFFFQRGGGDRATAKRFFPTVVRQLLDAIPSSRQHVARALEEDSLLCERNLQRQFEKLVLEPFAPAAIALGQPLRRILVVVIDALDECENHDDIRSILQLLARVGDLAPLRLRVFITSRPELPVQIEFRSIAERFHEDVVLEQVQTSTIEHDIEVFFEHKFAEMRTDRLRRRPSAALPVDWPAKEDVQTLVRQSVPLFIFASTICRFISESDPRQRLKQTLQQLGANTYSGLAKLYLPILQQLSADEDEESRDATVADFRRIVGSVVLLASPLSVTSLSSLIKVNQEAVSDFLERLYSVVSVPSDPLNPISLLHASFGDFLLDSAANRSHFWVDRTQTQASLAECCLNLLSQHDVLVQDICGVSKPGIRRADVDWGVVTSRIRPVVAYACQFWSWHVLESSEDLEDNSQVFSFLQTHFVHWLEALSWLGHLSGAVASISNLRSRAKGAQITDFLDDALRFILRNRYIIDHAPLQLYSSGLAFAPMESRIRKAFNCDSHRSFELFPAPPQSWGTELLKLEGHEAMIRSMVFSPDGRAMASTSDDGTVRLWNIQTGEERRKLTGSPYGGQVAFTADSQTLTVVSSGGFEYPTLHRWNAQTGELIQRSRDLDGLIFSHNAVLSPDVQVVATVSDCRVVLLIDINSREIMHTLRVSIWPAVVALIFSPDGKTLATGLDNGTVQLWDVDHGVQTHVLTERGNSVPTTACLFNNQPVSWASSDGMVWLWDPSSDHRVRRLGAHENHVTALAISHDKEILASTAMDQTLRLWNVKTAREVGRLECSETGRGPLMAMSPVSQVIVVELQVGVLQLWDVCIHKQLLTLQAHRGRANGLAFSPDGQVVASSSSDGTLRLWNSHTGGEIQKLKDDGEDTEDRKLISFSPDGRLIALTSCCGSVDLWDIETSKQLYRLEQHTAEISTVAFSTDGLRLTTISVDWVVRLWNVETGEQLNEMLTYEPTLQGATLSPDGQNMVVRLRGDILRLCDTKRGEQIQGFASYSRGTTATAMSSSGQEVASVSRDGMIHLWEARTGQQICQIETTRGHRISAMTFSPNGQILAMVSDQTLQFRDVQTGRRTLGLRRLNKPVSAMVFSSNGQVLVTSSYEPMGGDAMTVVRLWNANTGEEMQVFTTLSPFATVIAISPDGQIVALASEYFTIRLYKVQVGERAQICDRRTEVDLLVFTLDGQTAASGAHDGMVRLWNTRTGKQAKELEGHDNAVVTLAFSQNGLALASGSRDGKVYLWDVKTGEKKQMLVYALPISVLTATFSPNGHCVATTHDDDTVLLWNTLTGQLLHHVDGHQVRSAKIILAFSSDDQLVTTAGRDTSGQWRLGYIFGPSRAETAQRCTRVQHGATWGSPEEMLTELAQDRTICLWEARTGKRVNLSPQNVSNFLLQSEREDTVRPPAVRLPPGTEQHTSQQLTHRSGMAELELRSGWIRLNGEDTVHLPLEYRGTCHALYRNTLAIGQPSGAVLFFRSNEPTLQLI